MAAIATVEYEIDAKESLFTVQAFASVARSPKFAIRDLSGVMSFIPDSFQKASARVAIASTSLELQDEVKPEERREVERILFQEVLQTHRFPKIVFNSSAITATQISEYLYRVNVEGKLTLRGSTHTHMFDSQVTVGPDTLRATGNFALTQTDYGIRLVTAGGGTSKIRDELKFSFFVLARRRLSSAKV